MISSVQLCKVLEALGYGTYPGKEKTMENEMGHFIDWKFGVPVRIYEHNPGGYNYPEYEEARLIDENDSSFILLYDNGDVGFRKKQNFHYELIPHQQDGNGPVYPVCQGEYNTVYSNAQNNPHQFGGIVNLRIRPTLIATLNIDGKTIELSAETTTELKKKLGV